MRPMVRPGMHVARRDTRTLQLGLEWPGVAIVSATASVRAVLEAVDGFRDVAGVLLAAAAVGVPADDAQEALDALIDAGALVDQSVVKPRALAGETWSAMWLLAGRRGNAGTVLRSRQATSVRVIGEGAVANLVGSLLKQEQLPLTPDLESARVLVVASDQELSRDVVDDAMRTGLPFLCVAVRELVGLVGPFVVPGRSACLRCVDMSRGHLDPGWRTVIETVNASPAPLATAPPSLVSIVAGYAAQEITLWASGALPVSCDHVVEIPHGLGEVQTVSYPPHPQCGCGWQSGRETMSA